MQTGSSRDRGRICWYVVDRTSEDNETLKADYASVQVGFFYAQLAERKLLLRSLLARDEQGRKTFPYLIAQY